MAERRVAYCFVAVALTALTFIFSGKVLLVSIDTVFHYTVIHGLSTNGSIAIINPDTELMAVYPHGAHWLAVAVGYLAGSDFAGMMIVTIFALYLIYALIALLVLRDRGLMTLSIFALMLIALASSAFGYAVVGSEIAHGNFAYPQLVGDAVFFVVLFFMTSARSEHSWTTAIIVSGVATLMMWLQPLNAIQILGSAIVISIFHNVFRWRDGRLTISCVLSSAFLIIASIAIAGLHPKMGVMRVISQNNGTLVLPSWLLTFIIVGCAVPSVISLVLYFRFGTGKLDAEVGCSVLASIGLGVAQYLVFYFADVGSSYAIKKHALLITTLGIIVLARLVTRTRRDFAAFPNLLSASVATLATIWFLSGQGIPSAPLFEAVSFADRVQAELPEFRPGNTIYAEPSATPLSRLLISVAGLSFPITEGFNTLITGQPNHDIKYEMTRMPGTQDRDCSPAFSGAVFIIVLSGCRAAGRQIRSDRPLIQ
jgi:hypothetical protein